MTRHSRIAKRKIKMLSSELRMLQSYSTDMHILHEEYQSEFFRDMSFIESKLSTKEQPATDEVPSGENAPDCLKIDPAEKTQRWKKTEDGWEKETTLPPSEEPLKPVIPSWAKKLYKKIALVSHPDRTLQDHRRDKLNKIFTDSAQAVGEGDYKRLLGYALDLDIEIEDVSNAALLLSERIAVLKHEISTVEGSLPWLWGESLDLPHVRAKVAHSYFSNKDISLNNEEIISIIDEIEESSEHRADSKS